MLPWIRRSRKKTNRFFLETLIYTLQVGTFQNRMFLMEIRGNFAAVLWLKVKMICLNGKHDSSMKFTSPAFSLPFA